MWEIFFKYLSVSEVVTDRIKFGEKKYFCAQYTTLTFTLLPVYNLPKKNDSTHHESGSKGCKKK